MGLLGNDFEILNLTLEQIRDMENDSAIMKTVSKNSKDNAYGKVLSEKDFYPPADDRVLRSGVKDIDDSNNFAEFTHDFFELCDEEEIYD